MLVKQYQVRILEPELCQLQRNAGQPTVWRMTAHSLESAWRKFKTQHFGILTPNPADYDVHFDGISHEPTRKDGQE
jgi:hypothetical protein